MAKLQRKSAKLFAENANAGIGGVAQFGSLADGNPNYSKDVDVIQALDAYKNGWSDAVVGNKSPAIEDRNALDYLLSYQQAYIMQHGIPEWITTETYYKDCFVVDSNGELRVSVIDNNTGHNPIEDEGGQYWGFAGARGSGKRVGEVYFSQSSSATDNPGALPLFTGEVIANADKLYPQFYAWVLSHTTLCKTEAQYQTALSTYGECPYYVINTTNKTIRLPKLVNYIKMANTNDGVTQSLAGLPNITGKGLWWEDTTKDTQLSGAFYLDVDAGHNNLGSGSSDHDDYTVAMDASRSSSVYGRSNTNTPAHTTVFPWVCVYNAAIPASTAQAAEFQQALSSKLDTDFGNATVPYLVSMVRDGSRWAKIYSNGWCEQGGTETVSSSGLMTVSLVQNFASATYQVFKNYGSYKDSGLTNRGGSCFNKTSSSFDVYNSTGDTSSFDWEAKGWLS